MAFENGLSVADWEALSGAPFTHQVLDEAPSKKEQVASPAAEAFAAWVATHVLSVQAEPAYQQAVKPDAPEQAINEAKQSLDQAKLRLQDAFWRRFVITSRRNRSQILDRYQEAYFELEYLLARVAPPPLVEKVVIKEVLVEKHIEYEPLLIERME
jgi:hypothetical protein